ncbi:LysR family transcriptional regulator [Schauerella aestuarii]|uniref:LysR family transcriptional regulator n=1 Tax=Schauerella aestuarii TaxID=2511204 RepID=UPI00136F38BC|nr:LysR family transcriptional regulator [Achromobacter aestuarii]
MELRQLRQFIAVADAQSFSRAAEKLHMAQPPLSVAIRKLEEEVGTPLFEREARGVRLTPAGHAALDAARRCLVDADDVITRARLAADGDEGTLRIGVIGSVIFGLMPQFINQYSTRHPRVRLEVREATNYEIMTALADGTLDAGFVRVPTTRVSGVQLLMIEEDVFCVAMPLTHPLTSKKTLVPEDLNDQPFIGYSPSRAGGLHAAVTLLLRRANITPRLTQEAVQVRTAIGLVESGLGVALVPQINVAHMPRNVAYRPLRKQPPDTHIGIAFAYRETNETPPAKRFREMVGATKVRQGKF